MEKITILIFGLVVLYTSSASQHLYRFNDKTTRYTTEHGATPANVEYFTEGDPRVGSTQGRLSIIGDALEECFLSLKNCQSKLYLGDILNFRNIYGAYTGGRTMEIDDLPGSKSALLWYLRQAKYYDNFWGNNFSRYRKADKIYGKYFTGEVDWVGLGKSVIGVEIQYDHIQRNPGVYAEVFMEKTGFECPKSGCYDCDGEYSGLPKNGYACEPTVDFFCLSRYYNEEEYSETITCTIVIYPLIFESNYFFFESETGDPWASSVSEALFYILLHEFGHIETYWVNKSSYSTKVYGSNLNDSEKSASDFASSVWRDCR